MMSEKNGGMNITKLIYNQSELFQIKKTFLLELQAFRLTSFCLHPLNEHLLVYI